MTDQEIDKWVEEHLKVEDEKYLSDLRLKVLKWGKNIAHKFYRIGKSETPINLTWQDIKKIVDIAFWMLPKKNRTQEDYQKVLNEYNRLNNN